MKIPSLPDQLIAKMYSILDIKKTCLKVNIQMSYILHTCKLRFFESYSNFNVFEHPKLVTNYSDIDRIFKNVTKSSITERVMHSRPNTAWLPLLITSSHFIVTHLDDFPIGGGAKNIAWKKIREKEIGIPIKICNRPPAAGVAIIALQALL